MAYILNKTNGTVLLTVQDAAIDQTTDLKFLGRNYAGYGEFQNENFVKLLENFANLTPPPAPILGQVWYDTLHQKINVFNANTWKGIANIEISNTELAGTLNNNATVGDLGYYAPAEQLYAYNGTEYVLIGPPIGADKLAGWRGDYEQSTIEPGTPIYNIKAVIGSEVFAVVSNQEYIVNADTSNNYPLLIQNTTTSKLYKGITLVGANSSTGVSVSVNASNVYTGGTVLWGTAAHSISSNFSTKSGSNVYTEKNDNVYRPVAFVSTASGNAAEINIDYGFTYNASTNYVRATRFEGLATSALYADLAERYEADAVYEPGTVLIIGGDKEVTVTSLYSDTKVAGIVSTNPGYMMNSEAGSNETHPYIALKGRVPCKVVGPVTKGDLLVTSSTPGYAQTWTAQCPEGSVIAKALHTHVEGLGVIEVLVV
jgi:hypothetical protein